jgi:hypothetical protein
MILAVAAVHESESGTKRTSNVWPQMSALGRKADVAVDRANIKSEECSSAVHVAPSIGNDFRLCA